MSRMFHCQHSRSVCFLYSFSWCLLFSSTCWYVHFLLRTGKYLSRLRHLIFFEANKQMKPAKQVTTYEHLIGYLRVHRKGDIIILAGSILGNENNRKQLKNLEMDMINSELLTPTPLKSQSHFFYRCCYLQKARSLENILKAPKNLRTGMGVLT